MEIVAAAYRLSTTPLQEITEGSSTVQFLLTNSQNSILQAVE